MAQVPSTSDSETDDTARYNAYLAVAPSSDVMLLADDLEDYPPPSNLVFDDTGSELRGTGIPLLNIRLNILVDDVPTAFHTGSVLEDGTFRILIDPPFKSGETVYVYQGDPVRVSLPAIVVAPNYDDGTEDPEPEVIPPPHDLKFEGCGKVLRGKGIPNHIVRVNLATTSPPTEFHYGFVDSNGDFAIEIVPPYKEGQVVHVYQGTPLVLSEPAVIAVICNTSCEELVKCYRQQVACLKKQIRTVVVTSSVTPWGFQNGVFIGPSMVCRSEDNRNAFLV